MPSNIHCNSTNCAYQCENQCNYHGTIARTPNPRNEMGLVCAAFHYKTPTPTEEECLISNTEQAINELLDYYANHDNNDTVQELSKILRQIQTITPVKTNPLNDFILTYDYQTLDEYLEEYNAPNTELINNTPNASIANASHQVKIHNLMHCQALWNSLVNVFKEHPTQTTWSDIKLPCNWYTFPTNTDLPTILKWFEYTYRVTVTEKESI